MGGTGVPNRRVGETISKSPPSATQAVAALAARLELPLWCIGTMIAGKSGEVTVYDPDGNPVEFARRGYDHFA